MRGRLVAAKPGAELALHLAVAGMRRAPDLIVHRPLGEGPPRTGQVRVCVVVLHLLLSIGTVAGHDLGREAISTAVADDVDVGLGTASAETVSFDDAGLLVAEISLVHGTPSIGAGELRCRGDTVFLVSETPHRH